MEIELYEEAIEDFAFWKKSGNKAILKRIQILLKDLSQNPFSGLGNPEPLKYDLSGKFSRRINKEHRIFYSVSQSQNKIYIYSLKGHYEKK